MKLKSNILYGIIFLSVFFASCEEEKETSIPKPLGYMRVDLPKQQYESIDSTCPYLFEKSTLAELKIAKSEKPCNKNLFYKKFNATIHLSYIKIDTNRTLYNLIEDARKFAYGHQVKAASIQTEMMVNPKDKVYGLKYEITGDAASQIQFYLTDSVDHFLRGALYFNTEPNYDSLRPYIDFIHQDIKHLISSTHWKREN